MALVNLDYFGGPRPPQPDGTQGIATLTLTLKNEDEERELNGCIIRNDESLRRLINDYQYIKKYEDVKFFIYFSCLQQNLANRLVKMDIKVHRYTKPNNDKECTIIDKVGEKLFVVHSCHVFLPACHKIFKTRDFKKFLKRHSKHVNSIENILHGNYKAVKKDLEIDKLIFFSFNVTSSNNGLILNNDIFDKLEDGPLLDKDDKLIGGYKKTPDSRRITVHVFKTQETTDIWKRSAVPSAVNSGTSTDGASTDPPGVNTAGAATDGAATGPSGDNTGSVTGGTTTGPPGVNPGTSTGGATAGPPGVNPGTSTGGATTDTATGGATTGPPAANTSAVTGGATTSTTTGGATTGPSCGKVGTATDGATTDSPDASTGVATGDTTTAGPSGTNTGADTVSAANIGTSTDEAAASPPGFSAQPNPPDSARHSGINHKPNVDSRSFRTFSLSISNKITSLNFEKMKFLCEDIIPDGELSEMSKPYQLFEGLIRKQKLNEHNTRFLEKLLHDIGYVNLSKEVKGYCTNTEGIPLTEEETSKINFRTFLLSISDEINSEKLTKLKFLCNKIPDGVLSTIDKPFQLFDAMIKKAELGKQNTEFLEKILTNIGEIRLSTKVKDHRPNP